MNDYRYTDEADPQALRAEVARLTQDRNDFDSRLQACQVALRNLRARLERSETGFVGAPTLLPIIDAALAQPACPAGTEGACATCAAEGR